MAIGRPTLYNDDLADLICERISSGESMRSVGRDESMPEARTIFRWLREKETFSQQYARAKEESADAWADDIVDIPDNQTGVVLVDGEGLPILDEKGQPIKVVDAVAVAHARLRVDSRKWAASKLKPKKYGDKQQIEHTGKVELDDTARAARLEALLAKAQSRKDNDKSGKKDA